MTLFDLIFDIPLTATIMDFYGLENPEMVKNILIYDVQKYLAFFERHIFVRLHCVFIFSKILSNILLTGCLNVVSDGIG